MTARVLARSVVPQTISVDNNRVGRAKSPRLRNRRLPDDRKNGRRGTYTRVKTATAKAQARFRINRSGGSFAEALPWRGRSD
jgi:hypothetical protein